MFGLCVESSHERGMGHLYRAINLYKELKKHQYTVQVYINDDLKARSVLDELSIAYTVVNLKDEHSNWERRNIKQDQIRVWINDRLNTGLQHAKNVKEESVALVTFDDRGTGSSISDINFASLIFDKDEVLHGKKIYTGVDYLILNDEISRYKRLRTNFESMIISMGGSDTYNVTFKILQELTITCPKLTVVLGPSYKHRDTLESLSKKNIIIKESVPSLIHEFYYHDFAITGGGITPFEASASGLPCLVVASEEFEVQVGRFLRNRIGSLFGGHFSKLDLSSLKEGLDITQMSMRGMDGITTNGAKNVVEKILGLVL